MAVSTASSNEANPVTQFCLEVYEALWRLAEVHIDRLILILVIVMSTYQYCVFNLIAVLLSVFGACAPRFKRAISLVICFYVSAVFSAQFFTGIIEKHLPIETITCNFTNVDSVKARETVFHWIGFTRDYWPRLMFQLAILFLIGIQFAVYYRQRVRRTQLNLEKPPPGIIFTDAVDAQQFDNSLDMGIKVGFNYCFYKFGLEFSAICMIFVAWIRMDAVAAFLVSAVLFISLLHRSVIRVLWPLLVVFLVVEVPMQYAMELGMPLGFCIKYPWSDILHLPGNQSLGVAKNTNLLEFLDLASYEAERRPGDLRLIADFILLMIVIAQWFVFRVESEKHLAGSNTSIYQNSDFSLRRNNPYYDFIAEQRSFVDYIKIGVFMYGHWLTLIVLLAAGLGGQSLFSFGYLLLAFWILWQGNILYTTRRYKATLLKWYFICAYNVLVMLWKVSFQIVGCVFTLDSKQFWTNNFGCILRHLFSIACANQSSLERLGTPNKNACVVPSIEAKIGLDMLAFIFIIFQLRILSSCLFQRCIVEIICEKLQASRGAVLINQLVEKQMLEQTAQQSRKLSAIKERMAKIRKVYEDQHPSAVNAKAETHDQSRMIGDYYMFDYDPNTEESIAAPQEQYVKEVEPEASECKKLDPTQLIYTAAARGMNLRSTLEAVELAEQIENEEKRMIEAVCHNRKESSKKPDETEVEFPTTDCANLPKSQQISSKSTESKVKQTFNFVRFVLKLLSSCLHHASAFLNRHSRERRYVAYVLGKEKAQLKAKMQEDLYSSDQTSSDLRMIWKARGLQLVSTFKDVDRFEEEVQERWQQRSVITKFLLALMSFVSSYTDFLCYIVACYAHAFCSGLITLPLPLLVFLWATLSSPRPSKVFWIIMITYTELIILIQFVFQFDFFPWSKMDATETTSFSLPYVFGIQKRGYFAFWNVTLLVCLFLHRYMLRKNGLWNDANTHETFEQSNVGSNPQKSSSNATLVSTAREGSTPALVSDSTANQEVETEVKRTGLCLFYHRLRHPKIYYIRDVYPFMFFLDVICMLILIICYSDFGKASSNSNVLTSARIPIMFVAMIFILAAMMIADRALYLRKSVKWKLYYQLFTILLLHGWMLGILPWITQTKAVDNLAARWFYIFKCIHLIVSAWQIRNGYPKLCTGNMLTRSYGLLNYILFQAYMLMPWVFEVRTIVDWTWTESTMPLFDFIKMETFYSKIYVVKCLRVMSEKFPSPRGVSKSSVVKHLTGLPVILIMILLISSPLLLFSLLIYIGEQTETQRIDMTVSLDGYPPLYTMSAQGSDIKRGSWKGDRSDQEVLVEKFLASNVSSGRQRVAVSFINDYFTSDKADFLRAKFRPDSNKFWSISSQSLVSLKDKLQSNASISFHFKLKFVRISSSINTEPVMHTIERTAEVDPMFASDILSAIENPGEQFEIPHILPYFFTVPTEGRIKDADSLLAVISSATHASHDSATYSNATFKLHIDSTNRKLWTMQFKTGILEKQHMFDVEQVDYGTDRNLEFIPMTFFVDRRFPWFLALIAKGSLVATYAAIVYVSGRVVRSIIVSSPLDVIITELPNPDHILKICHDVYLVREAREFLLEEDLFARLLFLFRSPAIMIKWSRPKFE